MEQIPSYNRYNNKFFFFSAIVLLCAGWELKWERKAVDRYISALHIHIYLFFSMKTKERKKSNTRRTHICIYFISIQFWSIFRSICERQLREMRKKKKENYFGTVEHEYVLSLCLHYIYFEWSHTATQLKRNGMAYEKIDFNRTKGRLTSFFHIFFFLAAIPFLFCFNFHNAVAALLQLLPIGFSCVQEHLFSIWKIDIDDIKKSKKYSNDKYPNWQNWKCNNIQSKGGKRCETMERSKWNHLFIGLEFIQCNNIMRARLLHSIATYNLTKVETHVRCTANNNLFFFVFQFQYQPPSAFTQPLT